MGLRKRTREACGLPIHVAPYPAGPDPNAGRPCGRPKGHQDDGRGQVAGSHAFEPAKAVTLPSGLVLGADPPVRGYVKHVVWVPEGCRIVVVDPER